MIVNTEIRNITENNRWEKQLVVSYINKSGTISFLTYIIPKSELYYWKYTNPSAADRNVVSWDFKPVAKQPCNFKDRLPEQRVHEIILNLIKENPNIDAINDLCIPDTYFCDIEVDVDDTGFPDAEHAARPINTISWVHNSDAIVFSRKNLSSVELKWIQDKINEHCSSFKTKYNFTFVYHENEVDLLVDFFKNYVTKASCITGWNFFGYDWPYLYNRCKKLNINISFISPTGKWKNYKTKRGTEKIKIPYHKFLYDYLEIYMKWDRSVAVKEAYTLDWTAERCVGAKKVEHVLGFKDEWEQKPAEYVFYNAVDSILVREIDEKIKTSLIFFGLANLLHVDALDALSPVRSLEIIQGEYLYKEGRVFPNVTSEEVCDDMGYEGAYVYDPIPGVYKNVIALDFASLYPSTIRQFNISPETFIEKNINRPKSSEEIHCVSGAAYKRNVDGFIPKILTDVYGKRKSYKKEMMAAIEEKYELMEIYKKRFGVDYDK